MVSALCVASVRTTLMQAAQARLPRVLFESCETLRAMTAGRRALCAVGGRLTSRVRQEAPPVAPVVMPAARTSALAVGFGTA